MLIALNRLIIDETNVRAGTEADDQIPVLAASIQSTGLLQPLVVVERGKKYGVVAGRRRLLALQSIHGDKSKQQVECLVVEEALAGEASLAENYARAPMSTKELYLGMKALADRNPELGVEQIASAFGFEKARAARILRLASLHPTILQAWFDRSISDSTAQAYALTDDHSIQLEVFQLGTYNPKHEIKRRIAGEIDRNHIAIVGKDAYLAAGGAVQVDLFSDDFIPTDAALLQRLADEKIAEVKASYPGVEWVERAPQRKSKWGYDETDHDLAVETREEFASEADAQLYAELENEIRALDEREDFDTEEDYMAALAPIEAEMAKIEAYKVTIQPDVEGKPLVGILCFGYDGKPIVSLYIRDREAAGLPPVTYDQPETDEQATTASLSRHYHTADTMPDITAEKKASGMSRTAYIASQVEMADTVAEAVAEEAQNDHSQVGLDAFLFSCARASTSDHGTPAIKQTARGAFAVGKEVATSPPKAIGDWITEPSIAKAWEQFTIWNETPGNREYLGAYLLGTYWRPLVNEHHENPPPVLVHLIANELRQDAGPTEWAGRFDRKVLLDRMSHKARKELLTSWGLGDAAKQLKKHESADYVAKILDADAEQRKLYQIDNETSAVIDSWLPEVCQIKPVPQPAVEDARASDPEPEPTEEDAHETHLEDA